MTTAERIIREFGESGVETSFQVDGREYRAFAYPSPGRYGSRIRWNLYEAGASPDRPSHGVTFGIADGVQEAVEDLIVAAKLHATTGASNPVCRTGLTFRPSPDL